MERDRRAPTFGYQLSTSRSLKEGLLAQRTLISRTMLLSRARASSGAYLPVAVRHHPPMRPFSVQWPGAAELCREADSPAAAGHSTVSAPIPPTPIYRWSVRKRLGPVSDAVHGFDYRNARYSKLMLYKLRSDVFVPRVSRCNNMRYNFRTQKGRVRNFREVWAKERDFGPNGASRV